MNSQVPGVFIVVEGADGTGKTTLAGRLASRLREAGYEVVHVREPGGTPVAEAARNAVLDPDLDASPIAELFLFLAARADLVAKVIRPSIEDGMIVVGDRYALSTRAYQIAGRRLPRDAVDTALELATGGLAPSVTLILDAPLEVVLERQPGGSARDRIERAEDGLHRRVLQAFRDAEGPGVYHLDATRSPDQVEEDAWRKLQSCLPGTRRSSVG